MSDTLPIEIDVASVHQGLHDQTLDLLDCREPGEYETCHIEGAQWIPMREIPNRVAELPATEKPLVIHCHHGSRSLRVAQWLRQNGFPQAQSMAGGIDAWSETVDPSVPKY